MHSLAEFIMFWALAFVALCVALFLLKTLYALTENELGLHNISKEIIIASIASLVEGGGVWLIVSFLPIESRGLAFRALIFPLIIVALIYKVSHLNDWTRYDVLCLLILQIFISYFETSLIFGHFKAALSTLIVLVIILTIIVSFVKGLL